MKKLLKSKRGVSPVIATVLMILITMIGMTLLFGFVISYSDTYKAGIGSSVKESLTVEDVWVKPQGDVLVTVYNSATKDNLGEDIELQVATIYVDGIALKNADSSANNPNLGTINFNEKQVDAGDHAVFTCSPTNTIGNGMHYITIATQRGSSFKGQFTV